MARGNFRTSDNVCLYCGDSGYKMPYKTGKGANKIYLCEKCFSKTVESKEEDIKKYRNK